MLYVKLVTCNKFSLAYFSFGFYRVTLCIAQSLLWSGLRLSVCLTVCHVRAFYPDS